MPSFEKGFASKKALQKLFGLLVHPFMHKRQCMVIFHHIYVFIDRMSEKGLRRLPHYMKDEIACAVLLQPVAESNVRAPVHIQVCASDASGRRGGRAVTLTSINPLQI